MGNASFSSIRSVLIRKSVLVAMMAVMFKCSRSNCESLISEVKQVRYFIEGAEGGRYGEILEGIEGLISFILDIESTAAMMILSARHSRRKVVSMISV